MGILTSVAQLARIVGPLFVANSYTSYGPRVTFSIMTGYIFLGLPLYAAMYKRFDTAKAQNKIKNESEGECNMAYTDGN